MLANEVVEVFNETFRHRQVILTGGAIDPEYRPAVANEPAEIVFRSDYAASALHEVAHWCVAGASRRTMVDYGYWYCHDRDEARQEQFEQVEARPQGLQWIFSVAAGIPFRVSADNLALPERDLTPFRQQVQHAVRQWLQDELPDRALQFANALSQRHARPVNFRCLAHYEDLPK